MATATKLSRAGRWLATWGNGDWGRLGHGDWRSRLVPTRVVLPGEPIQVAAGGAHTLVLLSTGDVFSCGLNDCGQLGRAEAGAGLQRVRSLPADCCAVSAGDLHSLVVTKAGELWTFGRSADGREDFTPTRMPIDAHVTRASAGSQHSLALSAAGELYSWGARPQLGFGRERWSDSAYEATPRLVRSLRGVKLVGASAGRAHSGVVDDEGRLFIFGDGLGPLRDAREPSHIAGLSDVADVSCGGSFTLAVLRSGIGLAWGANEHGALGIGNQGGGGGPQEIGAFRQLRAGWKHSCGVNVRGELFCWGWGGTAGTGEMSSGGQCGQADEFDYWAPAKVTLPPDTRCLQVSAGYNHTVAILETDT